MQSKLQQVRESRTKLRANSICLREIKLHGYPPITCCACALAQDSNNVLPCSCSESLCVSIIVRHECPSTIACNHSGIALDAKKPGVKVQF